MSFFSKNQGFLQRQPRRFLDKKIRKLSLSPTLRATRYYTRTLFYIVIVVILIGITQYQSAFLSLIQEPFLDLSTPVFKVLSKPFREIDHLISRLQDIRTVLQKTENMHKIEEERDYWRAKADVLMRQNKELSEFIGFVHKTSEDIASFPEVKVVANVIASPGGIYTHALILEGGRRQKINVGDSAVTTLGLVGRIIEAGENASRVLLITDTEARIPVYLEKSGIQAILAGDSEKLPYLLRIQEDPLKSSPQVGERVLTSNLGGALPLGIPIGVIEEKKDASDMLRVRPFVHFNKLKYVGIIDSVENIVKDIFFLHDQASFLEE